MEDLNRLDKSWNTVKMKKRNIFYIILLLTTVIISCSCKNRTNDISIDNITIKVGQSYCIDIGNDDYKVNYQSKSDTSIKIQLSTFDKRAIINEFYSLGLNQLLNGEAKDTLWADPNCPTYDPVVYTYIKIESKNFFKIIKINENCRKNSFFNNEGKKLNKFLSYTRKIVFSKHNVKKLNKSDIMYL